jgi:tetratricopeptide (TPR) repeat protein
MRPRTIGLPAISPQLASVGFGAAIVILGAVIIARMVTPTSDKAWEALNRRVMEISGAGHAGEALPIAEQALTLAKTAFGPRDPRTLISMSNLAGMLREQGRFGEAELLLHETLQLRREALGLRNPDTLISVNNLAAVLFDEGRYSEAEPQLREALQLSREPTTQRTSRQARWATGVGPAC